MLLLVDVDIVLCLGQLYIQLHYIRTRKTIEGLIHSLALACGIGVIEIYLRKEGSVN